MASNAITFKYVPKQDDVQQRLLFKIASYLAAGLGLTGVTWINDTAVHNGLFVIFHAVTDCVITGVNYADGSSAIPGTTIKAGDRIYGLITSLQLTSGTGELTNAPY